LTPAPKGIRLRAAGVYVQGDKILLVRHEKEGRTYWLLPGGGCEFGEELATALERELREEAGIETKTGRLLFIAESIPPDQHRHVVNFTFFGEILGGQAGLNEVSERLKEVAWVERSKLASLTFFPNFKEELLQCWDEGFKGEVKSLGNLWEA
jgi:ADP-ribose pyrophosphatase YjhB (NUDIX family)